PVLTAVRAAVAQERHRDRRGRPAGGERPDLVGVPQRYEQVVEERGPGLDHPAADAPGPEVVAGEHRQPAGRDRPAGERERAGVDTERPYAVPGAESVGLGTVPPPAGDDVAGDPLN